MRKIIHIDMDAFYASIEQRDNPELKGKPVAVGYSGARGVVAAASYEARKYGVRSAMPSQTAIKKCPHLIFVQSRFDVYRAVSKQIMEIFLDYTDKVEPLSLDEAYLDVTVNHKNIPSATIIAKEIKKRIKETTGLTASAGVSVNKFLAKIASDINKPDGICVITAEKAEKFVEELKIERFFGVGRVTAEKMHALGIRTGKDLKARSETELVKHFGKTGLIYYQNARAVDTREVNPDRVRKSIGAENTYLSDIDDIEELRRQMKFIADEVWHRAGKREFEARTVTLKIKFSDFKQITRSKTYEDGVNSFNMFWIAAESLLDHVGKDLIWEKKVRLLGLSLGNNREYKARQLIFDFLQDIG
ncbi:DNA polymerase-4 [Parelusimicrobium proximum]|uniref:DNA polymerase IV n=1 Tax=Parelusimicrobium proximum TaxID=3228953 RepID=UPI003D16BEEB